MTVLKTEGASHTLAKTRQKKVFIVLRRLAVVATALTLLAVPASAGAASTRTFGDANRATLATVATGSTFQVTLSTPNWTFTPINSKFVKQVGTQTILTPQSGCTPGAPCGMTNATFQAVKPGQMRIIATRITCGEAMRCMGADALWTMVIRVR